MLLSQLLGCECGCGYGRECGSIGRKDEPGGRALRDTGMVSLYGLLGDNQRSARSGWRDVPGTVPTPG